MLVSNEELVLKIRNGEKELISDLWEQNKGLLRILSKPYISAGLEEDDALQEGFFAILDAVERFEPGRGTFAAILRYSVQRIVGSAFRESLYEKRIPANMQALIFKYKKLMAEAEAETGSPPNDYYLRFYLGITQTQLDDLRRAIHQSSCLSISQALPGAEDMTLEDLIPEPSDDIEALIDDLDREQARRDLWRTVGTLPPEQAEILKERYINRKTLQEIAEQNGINRNKVERNENKALQRLSKKTVIKQIGERFGYGTRNLYGGSLQAFKHTFTSNVEAAAIKHLEGI